MTRNHHGDHPTARPGTPTRNRDHRSAPTSGGTTDRNRPDPPPQPNTAPRVPSKGTWGGGPPLLAWSAGMMRARRVGCVRVALPSLSRPTVCWSPGAPLVPGEEGRRVRAAVASPTSTAVAGR